jgi:DNA-binding MarR family transcriptional regulator
MKADSGGRARRQAASEDRASSARRSGVRHTGNVLGALSLVVGDRTFDAIGALASLSPSDAIALSALQQFLDRPSIDQLAQVLGLSHSGAVRLVDRLAAAKFVRRTSGSDRRESAIVLTAAGRQAANEVVKARSDVLASATARLSADDREVLDRVAGQILAGMVRGPGARRWMCRFCDVVACGRDRGRCPVAREAGRRYGPVADGHVSQK